MSKKLRLIQTRFTNLSLTGGLSPKQVKKSVSKLHLVKNAILTEELKELTFIGEFRKEQISGKLIIDGKNTYRIVDYIGLKVRNYIGKFYQYALIKI